MFRQTGEPGKPGRIFETIGRQAKSEGRNRAGCEKHDGNAKTKTQPKQYKLL
jgi:hypothetical protein